VNAFEPLGSCLLYTGFTAQLIIHIYEVVWEIPVYGAADSVFLDQPFLYFDIHRLFSKCAEREKRVFSRCSYAYCDPP